MIAKRLEFTSGIASESRGFSTVSEVPAVTAKGDMTASFPAHGKYILFSAELINQAVASRSEIAALLFRPSLVI